LGIDPGTQRALSIAYITTLSWLEHLESARQTKREPLTSIVVVLDELEAHLHPKWQRTVLPSIMILIDQLSGSPHAQIHVATHSPLVLASIEPGSTSDDSLHHLELNDGIVELERANFPRLGTVDAWLTSDVFELAAPRSLDAQLAIERAEELLLEEGGVTVEQVTAADAALRRSLPDDDDFWIRWNFFKKNGNNA